MSGDKAENHEQCRGMTMSPDTPSAPETYYTYLLEHLPADPGELWMTRRGTTSGEIPT